MTSIDQPAPPAVQRNCGNPGCDVVDGGLRNVVDVQDGRAVFFHLPGDPACGAPDADPRPDLDEDANTSQVREGLRALGFDAPDDWQPGVVSIDCSDPAHQYADTPGEG